jgi:hypothetical protein
MMSGKWILIKAKPLVQEPSLVELKIAIGKLKGYKSPGNDQISAELIKVGGEIIIFCDTQTYFFCVEKEELPQQWMESVIVPINKKGD